MKKHYSAKALLLMGTLLAAATAQAQDAARVQNKVLGAHGQPELIQFSAAGKVAYRGPADGEQVLRQQLALGTNDKMLPTRVETDALGFTHQKFAQYYKGILVEHAAYTVHARGGAVESISGDYEQLTDLSTTPGLGMAVALDRALGYVGAAKYMWQDAGEEADLKQQTSDPAASYRPQGELVIVRNERSQNPALQGKPVLAWKFNVYAQQPVSRAYIYVDAQSGEVVLKDDIIKHAGGTASFATAYSGTRTLADETTTGGYRLREYTRGNGIETYNMKKSQQYNRAVDFVDADNNWTAAEYNNSTYDNVAGDAHFGAQSTYDYWKAVHARNSYDDAGAKIKSYVHYGRSYENAYWNGSVMTYGDGASTFKPLASLDVCGHEIGHAVCENTANLTYSNESGAMNEGLSDIWGACVEARTVAVYSLTGKSTWDIGEEIMKAGGALRSMSNPNLYGQPDTYKGTKWYTGTSDNGGVHTNSGVLNYWFYLLSQGGSGTNDLGKAFSVAGITIDKAAKITFRMEDVYMTASSTYPQARTYAIQAATDLYGAGSAEVTATTNAWYAVGVGAGTTAAIASGSTGTAAGVAGLAGAAEGLSVYPVPASTELTLTLPGNAAATQVAVTDLRGAAMSGIRSEGGKLNISGLASGVYMVSASDGQQTYHLRFIKQ